MASAAAGAAGGAIAIQSSDGMNYVVDLEAARCIKILESAIDTHGEELSEPGNSVVIPLQNVNSTVLAKILEWVERHKNDRPIPDDFDATKDVEIDAWDAGFLLGDEDLVFELNHATSDTELNIRGLYNLTCKAIAQLLESKTVEEIRATYSIANDITPQEEAQIRSENEWVDAYI